MQAAEYFLKNDYIPLIRRIPEYTPPEWGKMNLRQMVEHMSRDGFQVANGKHVFTDIVFPERVEKMQAFLRTDHPFRPNTVNILLPEEPLPPRHESLTGAINELEYEVLFFLMRFGAQPGLVVRNPIFGDLNYELWLRLSYKHAAHHLRQFGVLI